MIGEILKFSIQHRWIMLALTLIMVGLGAYNVTRLNIDAVPDITNIQVQVSAQAPGLSALEMEQRITFPLETGMAGLPRLVRTRSLSQYGITLITVIFEEGTDIYFARRLVSERIQEIKGKLPPGIEPAMGPISTGLGEIFMWTVEAVEGAKKPDGTPYTLTDLRTIQEWIIRPQLRNTPGVTEINTIGGYEKQFHVTPDPYKLISHGLTFGDVISALSANNANVGAGYIERSSGQYLVRVPGQVTDLEDIRNITLKSVHGTPIFIRDVATVQFGKELRLGAATKNGEETVLGTVFMLMGENSREVAQRAARKLEEVNRTLPEGVEAKAVYDRTTLVDKTIKTVTKSLAEGAILVVIILFIFLGNIRAAFITALVIPLSMLFTVTGMVTSKLTANLMSLGAIDFGIIVDGAVVIVENCARKLTDARQDIGRALTESERIDVIWEASQEVRKPMLFGELIIIIVYLPILTLTGVEGKMFTPMALTVLLALTGALILSFTFVPSAVAVFLSSQISHRENLITRSTKQIYRPLLQLVLKYRVLVVVTALVLVAVTAVAATLMGREFIPTLDEGDAAIHTMRLPDTSLSQALELQSILEKTLKEKFPQIETIVGRVGTSEIATEPHPPSVGDNTLVIKPRDRWPDPNLSKADLVKEIEEEASKLLGSNFEFSQPIRMRFNHLLSGVFSDVAVKVFGDDMDTLLRNAEDAAELVRKIPGASHVKVEQVTGLPILTVQLKRGEMARYGLNVSEVQDIVEIAVGGKSAGQVFEGDRRFDIVVRLPEKLRADVEALKRLPIPLPRQETGFELVRATTNVSEERKQRSFVSLESIADVAVVTGPNQISREDGKRRVVVTCNVRDRDLGSFVDEAQKTVKNNMKLPAGYWITWGGEFEQLLSAAKRLEIVVPLALFLILALLFAAFGSLGYALLVFTGVPLALTGGIIALWLRDIPLSISAAVGFIALSGVAVLNGLVMITFINKLRSEGKSVDEAIIQGALTRLRPVLMTALVASLGFVPMAIATGTGAEVQKPLATVVIGGLISSTVLTLMVLPALYSLVERRSVPDDTSIMD
ncbi:efflux RND transporter permease subunit [Desulfomonile tiedjei]|uniref:Heavy metal efflux pump, cobalt-zinc-cadmium n=1 Tax=Desulfomonile tiedjei (strain ATCC 49306 / DSM 6799 / DCB-1) TaxID=706587 RepID=I4C1F9_DESTA|nr:CusA/CzcA family heavy metal efflux RND transporter [Desulfomonile tiedjei]AFM23400.1 heavy metal efflux pump, cobalt-zinc-cadmium [Desulfomonile tiedjei DSM 6799]